MSLEYSQSDVLELYNQFGRTFANWGRCEARKSAFRDIAVWRYLAIYPLLIALLFNLADLIFGGRILALHFILISAVVLVIAEIIVWFVLCKSETAARKQLKSAIKCYEAIPREVKKPDLPDEAYSYNIPQKSYPYFLRR